MKVEEQKVQKTYRLSRQTIAQISDLSSRWGTSLTETVALIADRAFRGSEIEEYVSSKVQQGGVPNPVAQPVGRTPAASQNISDAKLVAVRDILKDGSKPYSQRVLMALKELDDDPAQPGVGSQTDGSPN
jgi:hypothetical protein